MRVYGLKNCDATRKAARALDGAELIDIRANPLSMQEITRFFDAFGEALLNRKSTTWRGLDEKVRTRDPLDLLIAHPTLMKRPVIEAAGKLYLGWGAETRAALL